MTDHIADFTHAMQAVGLTIDKHGVNDDGRIHQCKCPHDKANKKSGRYYLHSDGIANGAFGCYHESDNALANEWKSTAPTPTMSDAERKAYNERMERQRAERDAQTAQEQKDAQTACIELWGRAHGATSAHPYIERKGIRAYGVRELNGDLLVPMYDGKDNLCNIQFIQPDGSKKFKTGAKKKGAYFAFGATDTKAVVICEGFATGASIAQATGHTVVVAFDAGNLLPVAQRIKSSLPDGWRLIIAGDNDAFKPTNTGKDKATACAVAVGADVVIPDFTGCEITNEPTDFNDLHALAGLEAVKSQINGAQVLSDDVIEAVQAQAVQNAIESETDEQTIERMAKLSLLEYARQSKDASEKLGITPSQLKQVVTDFKKAQASKSDNGTPPMFESIEPWDSPVNGAQVLNEVLAQLQAHVIADIETLHMATLWVCMTWLSDVATVLPLAVITAPEKGCGKTTLLTAMSKMAQRPMQVAGTTTAFLFRVIELEAPTLFIDETDTFMRDNEELRGLINSGHTRDSAFIGRVVGDNHEPKLFSTWCAKALSGIGHLPETIESRAIILKMRRKLKGESARNIRHTTPDTFTDIKRRLARWADDNASAFSDLHPVMQGLSNRDADNYEPLLAIAMLAGGEWVQCIENACVKLLEHANDNQSLGVELLDACRHAFEVLKVERIKSTDLLEQLLKDDEAPFLTYNRGKPITARQIARRLNEYGIKPKPMRFGYDGVSKGYECAQFAEAFAIYLDGEKGENNIFSSVFPAPSVTRLQTNTSAVLSVTDSENVTVTKPPSVTPKAPVYATCNRVTDSIPQTEEKNKNVPPSNGFLRAHEPMTQNGAIEHDASFGEFVNNFAPETDNAEMVNLTFGGDE